MHHMNGHASFNSNPSPTTSNGAGVTGEIVNGHDDPRSSPSAKCKSKSKKTKRRVFANAAADIGYNKMTDFEFTGCDLLEFVEGFGDISGNNVDIDFTYGDTDHPIVEMAELYSYNELSEFTKNLDAFEAIMNKWGQPLEWKTLDRKDKIDTVQKLLNQLDSCDRAGRAEATKAILYLAQGCWSEIRKPEDREQTVRENVILLIKNGTFPALIQLLSLEVELASGSPSPSSGATNCANELGTILNIMYTFVETIRNADNSTNTENFLDERSIFISQLITPMSDDDDPIIIKLWNMLLPFTEGKLPVPIKKVLLLIWKILLLSLGGNSDLFVKKNVCRSLVGLPTLSQDTIEVGKKVATMQTVDEGLKETRASRRSFTRQINVNEEDANWDNPNSSLAESMSSLWDPTPMTENHLQLNGKSERELGTYGPQVQVDALFQDLVSPRLKSGDFLVSAFRLAHSHIAWTPKSRSSDVELFLEAARAKFIGISLPGDRTTSTGLPQSIQECVDVLRQRMYISLSEWQAQREFQLQKMPLSTKDHTVEQFTHDNPMDTLYQLLLPNLSKNIITLLKILMAAAVSVEKLQRSSQSHSEYDGVNIAKGVRCGVNVVREVYSPNIAHNPEPHGDHRHRHDSNKPKKIQTLDIDRHREIITKASSAILLLLLKHTKVSHVYLFESCCQHLIFGNCIPLILRYLNQNMHHHITTAGATGASSPQDIDIASLEFPACVLTSSEWKAESFTFSRRNLFSAINMLRILNKLCKWKPARTMMLVALKSVPIFRRALTVRHPIMQLYILKLIKMQTKYLGRSWRKGNLKLLSAIYQRVRPCLNDTWAYADAAGIANEDSNSNGWETGNITDCSFEEEEANLRAIIERHHMRRYGMTGPKPVGSSLGPALVPAPPALIPAAGNPEPVTDFDMTPGDYNIEHVLSQPYQPNSAFKAKYEEWLEKEVFQNPIDWDEVLNNTNGIC